MILETNSEELKRETPVTSLRSIMPEWAKDKWVLQWDQSNNWFLIEEACYAIFECGGMSFDAGHQLTWQTIGIFDDYHSAEDYACFLSQSLERSASKA